MANGYWILSTGATAVAAERLLDLYLSYRRMKKKQLRNEYKREFGMEPPEYLLLRELRDQVNARKEMRR